MENPTQEEILTGNKLIAEFMGAEFRYLENLNLNQCRFDIYAKSWINLEELNYHSSLDCLAPAIQKMEVEIMIHYSKNNPNREKEYLFIYQLDGMQKQRHLMFNKPTMSLFMECSNIGKVFKHFVWLLESYNESIKNK